MPRAFSPVRAARVAYLHAYHHRQPVEQLAQHLALTPGQVQALAASLGLPTSPAPTKRPYRRFTMQEIAYLRQHYQDLPPTHFAERWGVGVRQVYWLAYCHGIRRRAPNGQPEWRERRPVGGASGQREETKSEATPWGAGRRWAA